MATKRKGTGSRGSAGKKKAPAKKRKSAAKAAKPKATKKAPEKAPKKDPKKSTAKKGAAKTTSSAAERRLHPRYPTEGVGGKILFSTDAKVVNLSLDGLALETHTYLQVGREYSVTLYHQQDPIDIKGQVVWCTLVRTAKDDAGDVLAVYRAGVHFENMVSDQASRIFQFIERHAVVSLERRLFGRFRVQHRKPAHVDYEAEYEVRKISLGGLLIQTDIVPEPEAVFTLRTDLDGRTLSADGRIVHIQRLEDTESGDDKPQVLVGIEFVSLSDGAKKILAEFIQAHAD